MDARAGPAMARPDASMRRAWQHNLRRGSPALGGTIAAMPRWSWVLVFLVGCDPVAPSDAGIDAPFRRPDTGVDAWVPPLRVDLCDESAPAPGPYPAPDAFTHRGPGLGSVDVSEHPVGEHCAYLDGGALDVSDHHNLVAMYDGYLLLPW